MTPGSPRTWASGLHQLWGPRTFQFLRSLPLGSKEINLWFVPFSWFIWFLIHCSQKDQSSVLLGQGRQPWWRKKHASSHLFLPTTLDGQVFSCLFLQKQRLWRERGWTSFSAAQWPSQDSHPRLRTYTCSQLCQNLARLARRGNQEPSSLPTVARMFF